MFSYIFCVHILDFYCIYVSSNPPTQVRMDALGLVCESHRSTEVLTSQEMDLLRHFLLPNLNSQSPGVRQQTVSLLKKVSHLPHIVFGVCFFYGFYFLPEFEMLSW